MKIYYFLTNQIILVFLYFLLLFIIRETYNYLKFWYLIINQIIFVYLNIFLLLIIYY